MPLAPPIHSVEDGRSEKICCLYYGEPGIGKTKNLVGTTGQLARTLIVRPPVDHTDSITDTRGLKEWVVREWSDMDDVLLYMRTEGADKYRWVWLDSVSLWFDQGLDDIWEETIRRKPARSEFGLDQPEYGRNMERTLRWVRHMVGAPGFHLGLTAHVQTRESSEDVEKPDKKLMPAIQGRMMPPKLAGYMNMVGYYHWDTVGRKKIKARVLDLNSTPTYYAKDQFESTDNGRVINPTMPKIVEGIVASRKSAPAATRKPTTTQTPSNTPRPRARRRATRRTK